MTNGFDPPHNDVVLVTGADFVADDLVYKPGGVETDWPDGTAISLTFPDWVSDDNEWEYDIDGAWARLTVDKAIADTVPVGTRAELRYVNGDDDLTLEIGKVQRR